MSQIPRLLEVLSSTRSESLLIVEGTAITLQRPDGMHPITKQPLAAAQWRALAAEIIPAARVDALGDGEVVEQVVTHAGGEYAARVWREGGIGQIEVRATATARPSAEAPSASPPRAAAAAATGSLAAPSEPWSAPVDPAARARIDDLLREQMTRGGSDLHLRAGDFPLMRVHGDIVRLTERAPVDADALGAMLHAIMPERNRREFHETHDSDFAYELPGVARFRVNAFMDRHGPGAVARAIPSKIVTAEELGLSPEVQALCKLTKGLVLVTGPTGSGKSTTLCALVDLVNRTRQDHIVTIEDPIEFVHESKGCLVTQRQVGLHTGSFKHALRAALREDPDVVLVGELRDLETVSIAIETAETGHLVFGTLHTTTAASTIDRIIDQFPPDRQEQIRTMLSESLKGVIAQTLCRKVGGGRVAAMEVLLATPAVSNLIREAKTFQIPSVMQTSRRLGMITLNDALVELVEKGVVEPKEAYLRAIDKANLATTLK
ncbi:MAG TPA: type IV pilus twitching motility protein PilT, partial [Gemmatimonadaceae bacterium]|nr:type IV pilus twitching motility protein PilT [Gemmatimonadaceae bacterium]